MLSGGVVNSRSRRYLPEGRIPSFVEDGIHNLGRGVARLTAGGSGLVRDPSHSRFPE